MNPRELKKGKTYLYVKKEMGKTVVYNYSVINPQNPEYYFYFYGSNASLTLSTLDVIEYVKESSVILI